MQTSGTPQVVPGSFSVGTLSFGAEAGPGTPGFRFEQADQGGSLYGPATLAGPLASIIAVRQVGSARQARELTRPAARRWARSTPEAVA